MHNISEVPVQVGTGRTQAKPKKIEHKSLNLSRMDRYFNRYKHNYSLANEFKIESLPVWTLP